MNNKRYILLSLLTCVLSLLIFAYHREYIIFNFSRIKDSPSHIAQKKNATIHFWHQNRWATEQVSFLFSDYQLTNLQQIVSRWIQLQHEEKIIKKKVVLQSATITFDNQELILSFDRIPWNKELSTYDKWMTVEGLFKTIKEISSSIKKIRLLVNQQPLQDSQLDFTNSWPINGFI